MGGLHVHRSSLSAIVCGKDGKRVDEMNNTKMDRIAREGSSAKIAIWETKSKSCGAFHDDDDLQSIEELTLHQNGTT